MKQTIEKLLHQEFGTERKGYVKDQVDDFLDEVIEDIESLQKKFNFILDEKKILEKNNFELKMKLLNLQEKLDSLELANTTKFASSSQMSEQTINVKRQKPTPEQNSGEAIVHEDSKLNEYTLQERIEQLERDLDNIKNF